MTTDTSREAVEALRQSGFGFKTFHGPDGEMSALHLANALLSERDAAVAELATLKAERDGLREALTLFVDDWEAVWKNPPMDEGDFRRGIGYPVSGSVYERARAALGDA